MKNELILEIGTEEIPALFLEESTRSFRDNIEKSFTESSLEFEQIEIYYTPRRIAARVSGLLPEQKDSMIETFGPPKNIAYDEDGNPTKAAEGFARSQGVDVNELTLTKRDKGEFLSYRKEIKGDRTINVLSKLIPELIKSIPFRKSMRWGPEKVTFARPIRWLMCLYNNEVVDFSIENVRSSNVSYGHRFYDNTGFSPSGWNQYTEGLRERFVILSQHERKAEIKTQSDKIAQQSEGFIEQDEELMDTVTNLVEFPVVLKGYFEQKFTRLPDEVLVSVMKNHQKYFPVKSKQSGEIIPCFVFVCGSPVKDEQVVIRGNERVLRARLNDAEFFYTEDIKQPLIEKVDQLRDMVFLSEIGSFYEKTQRLESVSGTVAGLCGMDEKFKTLTSRAARLCKADLVSQMVFEFPELQGIMGRYYAEKSGEDKSVALAIEEHYMPTGRNSSLPESMAGAILSISDKIDNISSCFVAGLKPTGSADPYALRRQAIGIIQIILSKNFNFDIGKLVNSSLQSLNRNIDLDKYEEQITAFLSERFRNLMHEQGYSVNVIDSVVSTGFSNIPDCRNRIEALESFTKEKGFEELAVAFKRVVNIADDNIGSNPDRSLFKDPSEEELYERYQEINEEISGYIKSDSTPPDRSQYLKALNSIKTLKGPVDRFFDSVMVMDKDEKLKNNRLSLLNGIKNMFFRISDFSRV